MKKYLLILMLVLVPTLLMAQAAGGAVKRPVKKQQTTVTTPRKQGSSPKQNSTMTQAQKEQILQNLIANMVRVEGGTFTMGATSEQGSDAINYEKPAHQVTLNSFSIGKYEVTQEEWQAVMGTNSSKFKGAKLPVEKVSWDDCQKFIRKLNELTGKRFRLPTEAEWEYAARGGNRSIGYKYAGSDNLGSVAWYDDNSGSKTHPVGQKSPNELGLYDMSGNVWEWCQDWYGSYSSSSQANPTGPASGDHRVIRGGSWDDYARYCRSSFRRASAPSIRAIRDNGLGLRLALPESVKQEEEKQEVAGYDVTFSCNVSSASLVIDGTSNGTASGTRFLKTGSHSVHLSADGYEPLSQTIVVNSSSTAFSFSMTLSPVLQTIVNNMVRVEGGTFTMGATPEQGSDAYNDEKPAHQVTLSGFSIGKYEVTQEEWQAVMGTNPSKFKGANLPVEQVSWDDCQKFIRKLNELTGKRFRLPTEAEWEYAARGGNRSIGYKYAGSDNLGNVAWYDDNSGSKTHPVGQKSPNELGLYDMSGNVLEWCQDWYGSYSSSSQPNPTGPASGSYRVGRGGGWYGDARFCSSSYRGSITPSDRYEILGLRLAL